MWIPSLNFRLQKLHVHYIVFLVSQMSSIISSRNLQRQEQRLLEVYKIDVSFVTSFHQNNVQNFIKPLNVYDLLSLGPIVSILHFLGGKRKRASVLFIVILGVHTNFTV